MERFVEAMRREDDDIECLHDKSLRLEEEVARLRQCLRDNETKLFDARNKLSEADLDVTRARRCARDRVNATKRLQSKLEEASGERDVYQREVQVLEDRVKKIEGDHAKCKDKSEADIKVLRESLREEVLKVNRLNDTAAALRREVNRTRRTVREAVEARVEAVEAQLDRVRGQLDRERNASAALRDKLAVEIDKKRSFSKRVSSAKQQLRRVRKRESLLKEAAREEAAFFKVRRTSKPFHALSKKQQGRIKKKMKEKIGLAIEKIHVSFEVRGHGPVRIVCDTQKCLAAASGMITSVSMQKTSCYRDQVRKMLHLRDSKNVSKKKLHEFHMLYPDVIPSISSINKEENALNSEIEDLLSPEVSDSEFHVPVRNWLKFIIDHRGLKRDIDNTIHIMIEADGRGTGNSFHSVIMQMRVLNEGPTIFRNDRSYLLSIVAGKESHEEMQAKLGGQFDELEELQLEGLLRSDGVEVNVKIHFTSDAKFAQLAHGMMRFCDDGPNCLHCRQHSKYRTDLTRRCHIHANRFLRPGTHGQKKEDLLAFTPMNRRWSEGMHIAMRLCHDKLMKKAFQDVTNCQDEGIALSKIHEQMRSDPISIPSFEIFVFDDKEDEASAGPESSKAGKWSWRTPSFTQVKSIARHFDFVKAFPPELEDKAWEIQDVIRKWINSWTELHETWPGDGDPELTEDDIHDRHKDIITTATEARGDEDVEPGEDEFEESLWPLHIITPYCHTFVNHLGEMWENSKELSIFFNSEGEFIEILSVCFLIFFVFVCRQSLWWFSLCPH